MRIGLHLVFCERIVTLSNCAVYFDYNSEETFIGMAWTSKRRELAAISLLTCPPMSS